MASLLIIFNFQPNSFGPGSFSLSDLHGLRAERADPPVNNASAAWDTLRQILQQWEFTSNYAVVVGDATRGRLFTYEGNFTLKTKIPTGSTSKWPSAMMFAGLVHDGTVSSLEDPVNKYLSWWTKDPKDPRSTAACQHRAVTFRMLLTFTSGFGGGHPGEEPNTRAARQWRLQRYGSTEPVQRGAWEGAATARGKGLWPKRGCQELPGASPNDRSMRFHETFDPSLANWRLKSERMRQEVGRRGELCQVHLRKREAGWEAWQEPGQCSDVEVSTGDRPGLDYEKFMANLLSYKTYSKELVDASEADATPFMKDGGVSVFAMGSGASVGMIKKRQSSKKVRTAIPMNSQANPDPADSLVRDSHATRTGLALFAILEDDEETKECRGCSDTFQDHMHRCDTELLVESVGG
eukprot:Skav203838  [mRNA]  locus=scaffold4932:138090:147729:- [translate_table: standard]